MKHRFKRIQVFEDSSSDSEKGVPGRKDKSEHGNEVNNNWVPPATSLDCRVKPCSVVLERLPTTGPFTVGKRSGETDIIKPGNALPHHACLRRGLENYSDLVDHDHSETETESSHHSSMFTSNFSDSSDFEMDTSQYIPRRSQVKPTLAKRKKLRLSTPKKQVIDNDESSDSDFESLTQRPLRKFGSQKKPRRRSKPSPLQTRVPKDVIYIDSSEEETMTEGRRKTETAAPSGSNQPDPSISFRLASFTRVIDSSDDSSISSDILSPKKSSVSSRPSKVEESSACSEGGRQIGSLTFLTGSNSDSESDIPLTQLPSRTLEYFTPKQKTGSASPEQPAGEEEREFFPDSQPLFTDSDTPYEGVDLKGLSQSFIQSDDDCTSNGEFYARKERNNDSASVSGLNKLGEEPDGSSSEQSVPTLSSLPDLTEETTDKANLEPEHHSETDSLDSCEMIFGPFISSNSKLKTKAAFKKDNVKSEEDEDEEDTQDLSSSFCPQNKPAQFSRTISLKTNMSCRETETEETSDDACHQKDDSASEKDSLSTCEDDITDSSGSFGSPLEHLKQEAAETKTTAAAAAAASDCENTLIAGDSLGNTEESSDSWNLLTGQMISPKSAAKKLEARQSVKSDQPAEPACDKMKPGRSSSALDETSSDTCEGIFGAISLPLKEKTFSGLSAQLKGTDEKVESSHHEEARKIKVKEETSDSIAFSCNIVNEPFTDDVKVKSSASSKPEGIVKKESRCTYGETAEFSMSAIGSSQGFSVPEDDDVILLDDDHEEMFGNLTQSSFFIHSESEDSDVEILPMEDDDVDYRYRTTSHEKQEQETESSAECHKKQEEDLWQSDNDDEIFSTFNFPGIGVARRRSKEVPSPPSDTPGDSGAEPKAELQESKETTAPPSNATTSAVDDMSYMYLSQVQDGSFAGPHFGAKSSWSLPKDTKSAVSLKPGTTKRGVSSDSCAETIVCSDFEKDDSDQTIVLEPKDANLECKSSRDSLNSTPETIVANDEEDNRGNTTEATQTNIQAVSETKSLLTHEIREDSSTVEPPPHKAATGEASSLDLSFEIVNVPVTAAPASEATSETTAKSGSRTTKPELHSTPAPARYDSDLDELPDISLFDMPDEVQNKTATGESKSESKEEPAAESLKRKKSFQISRNIKQALQDKMKGAAIRRPPAVESRAETSHRPQSISKPASSSEDDSSEFESLFESLQTPQPESETSKKSRSPRREIKRTEETAFVHSTGGWKSKKTLKLKAIKGIAATNRGASHEDSTTTKARPREAIQLDKFYPQKTVPRREISLGDIAHQKSKKLPGRQKSSERKRQRHTSGPKLSEDIARARKQLKEREKAKEQRKSGDKTQAKGTTSKCTSSAKEVKRPSRTDSVEQKETDSPKEERRRGRSRWSEEKRSESSDKMKAKDSTSKSTSNEKEVEQPSGRDPVNRKETDSHTEQRRSRRSRWSEDKVQENRSEEKRSENSDKMKAKDSTSKSTSNEKEVEQPSGRDPVNRKETDSHTEQRRRRRSRWSEDKVPENRSEEKRSENSDKMKAKDSTSKSTSNEKEVEQPSGRDPVNRKETDSHTEQRRRRRSRWSEDKVPGNSSVQPSKRNHNHVSSVYRADSEHQLKKPRHDNRDKNGKAGLQESKSSDENDENLPGTKSSEVSSGTRELQKDTGRKLTRSATKLDRNDSAKPSTSPAGSDKRQHPTSRKDKEISNKRHKTDEDHKARRHKSGPPSFRDETGLSEATKPLKKRIYSMTENETMRESTDLNETTTRDSSDTHQSGKWKQHILDRYGGNETNAHPVPSGASASTVQGPEETSIPGVNAQHSSESRDAHHPKPREEGEGSASKKLVIAMPRTFLISNVENKPPQQNRAQNQSRGRDPRQARHQPAPPGRLVETQHSWQPNKMPVTSSNTSMPPPPFPLQQQPQQQPRDPRLGQSRLTLEGFRDKSLPLPKTTCESSLTLHDYLKEVLKWSPSWLPEQEKNNEPPPVAHKHSPPLLETYDSIDDYIKIMMPLMLLETWATVHKDWKASQKARHLIQHSLLPVSVVMETQHIVNLHCQGVFLTPQIQGGNCVREGDLVIATLAGGSVPNLQTKHVFGYVKKVTRTLPRRNKPLDNLHHAIRQELDNGPVSNKTVLGVIVSLYPRQMSDQHPVKLQVVCSLVSKVRQASALCFLKRNTLVRDLLRPVSMQVFASVQILENQSFKDLRKTLNYSQARAVTAATKAALGPGCKPEMCLLQGPPGTGKSTTIVKIVQKIIADGRRSSQSPHILLCAPSNGGIDELVRRLAGIPRQERINFVRVGPTSSMHESVLPYSLDERVKRRITREQEKALEQSLDSVKTAHAALEKKLQKLKTKEIQERNVKNYTEANRMQREIEGLEKRKKTLLQQSGASPPEILVKEQAVRTAVLRDADIVCCTLNGSGSSVLETLRPSTGGRPSAHFTYIIVDEASQCIEVDCLIPLQYGCCKLLLVGDPYQLPATVLCQKAQDKDFGQSLFERLFNHFKLADQNPVMLLDTQYRMHPEICHFPSQHIYNGLLKTDPETAKKRQKFPYRNYLVFDLAYGAEMQQREGSVANEAEAKFVVQLCQFLFKRVKQEAMGIITPYQMQKNTLRTLLNRSDLDKVEVGTVDGFQGREKDAIVMSCVRAQGSTGTIGFLSDRRRMNVSLTRARYGMYVVGHLNSLKVNDDWRALIDDAQRRQRIVRVERPGDAEFRIGKFLSH